MKKLSVVVLLVLCLGLLAACGGSGDDTNGDTGDTGAKVLSQDVANVTDLTVYAMDGGKASLAAEDADAQKIISALAAIKGTEGVVGEDVQAYKYAIDITYQDEKVDQIFSDEAGENFYRFTDGENQRVMGEAKGLAAILDGLLS